MRTKGRHPMTEYDAMKERIMDLVATSKGQRLRPVHVAQTLSRELDLSPFTVNAAVRDLVDDGELVYAYRDPTSYVEIPCNGCDGEHRAARPMQIVTDGSGNTWICDVDAEPDDSAAGHGCWQCGSLTFTR